MIKTCPILFIVSHGLFFNTWLGRQNRVDAFDIWLYKLKSTKTRYLPYQLANVMANPRKLQHTLGTHPAIPLDNYEGIHLASPFVKAAWGVCQKGVELTLDINSGQQHI